MLALPRICSIDHAVRESSASTATSLSAALTATATSSRSTSTTSPPGLHTSPVLCGSRNSSTTLAADRAAAWLAQGPRVASAPPATRCSGTPAAPPADTPVDTPAAYPVDIPAGDTRSAESGTAPHGAPRRLVRACSFERKVGQQRRGPNPDNSTRSKLQRSVSFGHKPRRRPSASGEAALQLEPTVRRGLGKALTTPIIAVHLRYTFPH